MQPKLIAKRMGFIQGRHAAASQKLRQKCQDVLHMTPEAGEATIRRLDLQIKAMTDGEALNNCHASVSGFGRSLGPLAYQGHGTT